MNMKSHLDPSDNFSVSSPVDKFFKIFRKLSKNLKKHSKIFLKISKVSKAFRKTLEDWFGKKLFFLCGQVS